MKSSSKDSSMTTTKKTMTLQQALDRAGFTTDRLYTKPSDYTLRMLVTAKGFTAASSRGGVGETGGRLAWSVGNTTALLSARRAFADGSPARGTFVIVLRDGVDSRGRAIQALDLALSD